MNLRSTQVTIMEINATASSDLTAIVMDIDSTNANSHIADLEVVKAHQILHPPTLMIYLHGLDRHELKQSLSN